MKLISEAVWNYVRAKRLVMLYVTCIWGHNFWFDVPTGEMITCDFQIIP